MTIRRIVTSLTASSSAASLMLMNSVLPHVPPRPGPSSPPRPGCVPPPVICCALMPTQATGSRPALASTGHHHPGAGARYCTYIARTSKNRSDREVFPSRSGSEIVGISHKSLTTGDTGGPARVCTQRLEPFVQRSGATSDEPGDRRVINASDPPRSRCLGASVEPVWKVGHEGCLVSGPNLELTRVIDPPGNVPP